MPFACHCDPGAMVFSTERFGRTVRIHADVAQLVEHHLAKVRVAGSSPVIRSMKPVVLSSVLPLLLVGWPSG